MSILIVLSNEIKENLTVGCGYRILIPFNNMFSNKGYTSIPQNILWFFHNFYHRLKNSSSASQLYLSKKFV